VPDVQELRRKRDEDAAKCGRIVRTIGKDSNQIPCPIRTSTGSEVNFSQKNLTEGQPSTTAECEADVTRSPLLAGYCNYL